MDVTVVVPVKAFRNAKARLTPALDPQQRHDLAIAMATVVLRAAAPLPVTVVCDDDEVSEWAAQLGADVVWAPDLGLNGAVRHALDELSRARVDFALVAHADLPLASNLQALIPADPRSAVIVPDRRRDGTNLLGVAPDLEFRFGYGANSFSHHLAEARRLGLAIEVVDDAALSWDVDVPGDLDLEVITSGAVFEACN